MLAPCLRCQTARAVDLMLPISTRVDTRNCSSEVFVVCGGSCSLHYKYNTKSRNLGVCVLSYMRMAWSSASESSTEGFHFSPQMSIASTCIVGFY